MWKYYALSFLLHILFISTYWGWINKFLGVKTEDKVWFNWLLHGIGIGAAMIPFAWIGLSWTVIITRMVVLGTGMMVWSLYQDIDYLEEFGRGLLIVLTLLLIL